MVSDAVGCGNIRLDAVKCGWMRLDDKIIYTIAVLCGCGTLRMRSNVDAVEFGLNAVECARMYSDAIIFSWICQNRLESGRMRQNTDVFGWLWQIRIRYNRFG